ncbi:2-oxoisovalerate dehydrogenase subunit alpha 2, mitochondrial [Glycine max]|nr:2-oxoisovalerate dehydrogenase subunit alpha 2, mitochondrial [Glycine max]
MIMGKEGRCHLIMGPKSTITLHTQISHAVGAAYSLKMDKKDTCAITYFGDDGSRTFPCCLKFCNSFGGPSDGVVAKGQAYGVRSIRDGNEALDIYSAIQASRQMAITESKVGHHSTSDDSTKYCPTNEIEWWRLTCDSVARFRKWIEKNRWWNDMAELLINNLRQQARYTSLNPLNDDN